MRIIGFEDIKKLQISPALCVEWVNEAFIQKSTCYLPPKLSLKFENDIFLNTMFSYIPKIGIYGVKVVSRFPERSPSLDSIIQIFDTSNGELIALIDGNWITAMRTGAVASLAIKTLEHENASNYSLLGLGNTARATVLCMLESRPEKHFTFKILKYKDQAELFIERFKDYKNISFEIVDDNESLIKNADVVISCVTAANTIIGEDNWYKEGVLVVPIHTRGFQNCDLFFDKVFADDRDHVIGFKYFDKFKKFNEIDTVLKNINPGRESQKERILSYNIGIAIHDVYFAGQIIKHFTFDNSIDINKTTEKFWV